MIETVKALSLWQPWASLWLTKRKIHETRHWPLKHRGRLIVHAAKKLVSAIECDLEKICCEEFGPTWRKTLPTGSIIGEVQIIGCITTSDVNDGSDITADDVRCGDWSDDRFGFTRSPDFKLYEKPIPFIGRQGQFNVPISVLP